MRTNLALINNEGLILSQKFSKQYMQHIRQCYIMIYDTQNDVQQQ